MRIRRILRAVFALAGVVLIAAYFYMRVEQFPRNSIHVIWIVAMLCCWVSVFATWKDKAKRDS